LSVSLIGVHFKPLASFQEVLASIAIQIGHDPLPRAELGDGCLSSGALRTILIFSSNPKLWRVTFLISRTIDSGQSDLTLGAINNSSPFRHIQVSKTISYQVA
jgi:hypothetical protein